MTQRLRTFLVNIPNIPTMLAFKILRRAIQRDPAYAEGWQSNIAMAIYDESRNATSCAPLSGEFCNQATARFMRNCFGAPTR